MINYEGLQVRKAGAGAQSFPPPSRSRAFLLVDHP